jgi:tetratricopeptide (TPR) repeat protein
MVFISYARKASASAALALFKSLTREPAVPAFLDTSEIEAGDLLPQSLIDALLRSTIVVVFLEDLYFRRWYCLRELRTALAPFDTQLRRNANPTEAERALGHIVIALPGAGARPEQMDHLPPFLARLQSWPGAHETDKLDQLVRNRYASFSQTLAERIGDRAIQPFTRSFLSEAVLPEPVSANGNTRSNRGAVPQYAQALPQSLEEKFVGRANDLWRIHFALSTLHHFMSNSGGTVAIEGGAGFGKSRLALEYFRRFGPRHYPGGNFWVDASGGASLLSRQFQGILEALYPSKKESSKPDATHSYSEELGKALHIRVQSAPVLFVVDNVPEGVNPQSLDVWCPAIGEVSCLITSRTKVSLWSKTITEIQLDTIDTDSAVALLTDGINQPWHSGVQWRKFAEMTGNLPLALELLNRTLRAPGTSALRVLARMEQSPIAELEKRYAVLKPHVPEGTLRGVGEAFAISYRILKPGERKAARLLAHLAPDAVPLRVLELLGPSVVPEAIRVTLAARSFVSPIPSGDVEMFGAMHRLLADFLRSRSKNQEEEQRMAAAALADAMANAPSENPKDWPLVDACLPHANRFFEQFSEGEPKSETSVRIGSSLGIALLFRGASKRAREVLEPAGLWALALWGPDHDLTLQLRANLASALKAQGEYRSAEVIERLILAFLNSAGEIDSHRYLTVLNNLGVTLGGQGKHSEALKIRKEHLAACATKSVPTEMLLMSANNLAITYADIGDTDTATKLQEYTLQESQKKLGERHPETLISKNNLAGSLAKKDPERAISLLREVIETSKVELGAAHPRTLQSTRTVAGLLSQRGKHEQAIQLLEQALDASKRKWGDDDEATLAIMSHLGSALARSAEME